MSGAVGMAAAAGLDSVGLVIGAPGCGLSSDTRVIKGKPVYRFLDGAAGGNRSRVPIRLVPGEFVKAVRKAGVNEIAQILETELFEDPDRSSVLREYKSHDPGELQIAKAIFEHGSGGFSGVSLAPKLQTQPITQLNF